MRDSSQILVTGATSDLALALINQAINREEYKLLLVSRGQQDNHQFNALAEVMSLNKIDLSDEANHERLSQASDEFFDGPFSVIHFAGDFWKHKTLQKTKFSEFNDMINSHYITLCSVAKAVTPIMIKKGGGRLVAFSCNSVSYNYPDMAPFTCAKAAVECFVKCYANEHSEYNISATALALPTMRTKKVIVDKPKKYHESYISPDELSKIILDQILTQEHYLTGNVLRLFKHSLSFYNEGYFNRNPRPDP